MNTEQMEQEANARIRKYVLNSAKHHKAAIRRKAEAIRQEHRLHEPAPQQTTPFVPPFMDWLMTVLGPAPGQWLPWDSPIHQLPAPAYQGNPYGYYYANPWR